MNRLTPGTRVRITNAAFVKQHPASSGLGTVSTDPTQKVTAAELLVAIDDLPGIFAFPTTDIIKHTALEHCPWCNAVKEHRLGLCADCGRFPPSNSALNP